MKIQLKNDQLEVSFDSLGAELQSIKKDGLEYLWQADKAFWARHAPILFPIVGKLKNGHYHVGEDETSYEMGGHGFARDSEFALIHEDHNDLAFELSSNETTKVNYPFDFDLKVSYHLKENQLKIRYQVENNDEKTMYFGVGAHPAFNVPIDKGSFEDYMLTIFPLEERIFIPLDAPSGMIQLDGRKEVQVHQLPLQRELFKGDALVYSSSPEMEVTLTNHLDSHSVKMSWEGMPYFGLWSPYPAEAPFVCIEPWCGIADDGNTDGDLTNKFGINSLEPAETFSCEYTIEIN